MKRKFLNIILILLSLFFISCSSSRNFERINSPAADGKYDSEFPYINASKYLEEISDCIRLINSIAFYTSYVFDSNSLITIDELKKVDFEKKAIQKVYFNRTASGTATLIYKGQDKILFLTVAHVVSFEDTLISFFIN